MSIDAISEFSVLTNQFSAEYGQSMSGIVSVITKSGTNRFSGSGFLFVRPGSWDARDRLTGRRAPYDRQDTGFTFGGPIAKDRTHFFSNLEYRNEDDQAIVTATLGGGQFQGTFPIGSERLRLLTKVNHRFNEKNMVTASFIFGDETGRSGIGNNTVGENPQVNLNDDRTIQATYTLLISDRTVNELKFAYSNENYSSERQATTLTPTGVGLTYPGTGHDLRVFPADRTRLGAAVRRQSDADARPAHDQGGRQREQRDARRRAVPEPPGQLHVRAERAVPVQSEQPGVVPDAVQPGLLRRRRQQRAAARRMAPRRVRAGRLEAATQPHAQSRRALPG